MKFHCVAYAKKGRNTTSLLAQACAARGVEFVLHDPSEFDYLASARIEPGDAAYRVAVDTWPAWPARALEHTLLRDTVATFYTSPKAPNLFQANIFQLVERAGLPVPKTIPHLTRKRAQLKEYVAALGGFPVVLKVHGGSSGVGVMKVDSLPSLISIVDYLLSQRCHVVMRQFIETRSSARLVVIGSEVAASIEFESEPDDFRSNSGTLKRSRAKTFAPEIETLAVAAVKSRGVEFGGVDIIFDGNGRPYITEVNFPCRFTKAEQLTGVDVAGKMIEHLRHKAAALTVTPAWHVAVS